MRHQWDDTIERDDMWPYEVRFEGTDLTPEARVYASAIIDGRAISDVTYTYDVTFPADAQDILTVGAVNNDRKNAPFCGVGPTQDGRVKPDVTALGSPASLISGRGTIIRDMGTSFSTPIVAGLVACLWQALPNKTALEIIDLIRQTSSQYQYPDNVYGYGIPNFWRAYMIGKVNNE
jgi:subtilisin family serine protease